MGIARICRQGRSESERTLMSKYIYFFEENKKTVSSKLGFCWPAFLFGFFWALKKRAWYLALILFVMQALLFVAEGVANSHPKRMGWVFVLLIMQFVLMVTYGKYGNFLLKKEFLS